MNFEDFVNIFKKIEGIKILETRNGPNYIKYSVNYNHVQEEINKISLELKEKFGCDISNSLLENNKFKLFFGPSSLDKNIKMFVDRIMTLISDQDNERKKRHQEFGLPDMSLVTIRQMTEELKKRKNLVFSLVWIENNENDNISIEGSGNPTQVVGLLTRGTHMAIEWADQNIRFNK